MLCRQTLDSLKSLAVQLFGPGEKFRSATPNRVNLTPTRGAVFTPKHPGLGKSGWDDVEHKGDWMRRPITDGEVAWLVRLLVGVSDRANKLLGLDRHGTRNATRERVHDGTGSRRGWRYVDLNMADVRVVGFMDAIKMFVGGVGSSMVIVCSILQRFMREHDLKVNLRVLASRKAVTFSLIVVIVYTAKVALRLESTSAQFVEA